MRVEPYLLFFENWDGCIMYKHQTVSHFLADCAPVVLLLSMNTFTTFLSPTPIFFSQQQPHQHLTQSLNISTWYSSLKWNSPLLRDDDIFILSARTNIEYPSISVDTSLNREFTLQLIWKHWRKMAFFKSQQKYMPLLVVGFPFFFSMHYDHPTLAFFVTPNY